MDFLSRPLSKKSARTLYNVVDAGMGEGEFLEADFAEAFERDLRHAGVSAARRTWLLLCWIEWSGVLRSRSLRSFSASERSVRRRRLRRVEASRWPAIRSAVEDLRDRIARARGSAPESQSSSA